MTADDAALYDERDDALLRADRAEDELDRLQASIARLEARDKHIGWYYRKWHVAEAERKRLEADVVLLEGLAASVKSIRDKATADAAALERVIWLADAADQDAGGDRHDSISGRVTTREVRRVIAGAGE